MDYYSFDCQLPAQCDAEIVLAYLSELPFDTFETEDTFVKAYIPVKLIDDSFEASLAEIKEQFQLDITRTLIPGQNWNQLWESNFQPIRIGDFCVIRADFHEPVPGVEHDLIINPKMAFGTGHHETTHLMIEAMEQIAFHNSKVLDFGCGTGILAIVALRLGAARVQAVDIEQPACENTIENVAANGGGDVETFLGGLEQIKDADFDIILANINRNVILENLPTLYDKLKPGGFLLISGFLDVDEDIMVERLKSCKFSTPFISRRNKWLCMTLKRT